MCRNMNQKRFIPVMLTPFKEDKSIDYDNLDRLIDYYLFSGATGLFANCLSSEMFQLFPDERIALTRHVVQRVNGRFPVFATATFSTNVKKQADFIHKIYDTGIEAAILITNMFMDSENTGDAEYKNKVFALLNETSEIPLGFYECPEPFKKVISPELLREFVRTERVKYYKDTCLDIEMVRKKIKYTKDSTDFQLFDAYMVHAIESLKAGSSGLSCIQGNYFADLIVWFCKHYDDDNCQSQLQEIQEFLTRNMDLMHDFYPLSGKFVLSKKIEGFPIHTRVKQQKLNPAEVESLNNLYEEYTLIKERLEI